MVNDTTRLLGLDGVAVVAVEDVAEGGLVVHLATVDERARAVVGVGCGRCGSRSG